MKRKPLFAVLRQISSPRLILPALFALISGKDRYIPEFEWAEGNWTHNAFRAYESVFGREYGIRAEATSVLQEGVEYHFFHSFESVVAEVENQVRRAFTFKPFRVYVPVFQLPGGIPMPASPFLFAIAYDNHSHTTSAGTTLSHTVTGSNPCLIGFLEKTGATTYTMTYNSVTIVLLNNQSSNTANQSGILVNPATGSNTMSSTGNGTTVRVIATSYSGVGTGSGTGGCDDAGGAQGTVSATLSNTLNLSANAWAILYAIGANNLPSGTTTCTTERSGGSIDASKVWDSGGALGGGSTGITSTFIDTSFCQLCVGMKPTITDYSISVSESITITESATMEMNSFISVSDAITITDVVVGLDYVFAISVFDAITITESVTVTNSQLGDINVNDAITITESVTVTNSQLGDISVSDSLTITESVLLDFLFLISVSDDIAISESVEMMTTLGDIFVFDAIGITESVSIFTPDRMSGIAIMRSAQQQYPLGMDDETIL